MKGRVEVLGVREWGVRGSASIIEAVVGLAVKWSDSCTHKHGVRWSMRDVEVEVGQRKMREKREQIIDPPLPPAPPPSTPHTHPQGEKREYPCSSTCSALDWWRVSDRYVTACRALWGWCGTTSWWSGEINMWSCQLLAQGRDNGHTLMSRWPEAGLEPSENEKIQVWLYLTYIKTEV